eukprot:CAMPEP_0172647348 /NCGR_PEP_ID=MMETSP1068-20121228/240700_1 /TAXON_ID=35684 /ORGANISM="Pseudopedinella elastica, Strain CCMP716" /LENGTH=248 /DNA_ID=CAMNT_0013461625 /DNA_START=1446 /DNA_END=2193 /DNA_ORIENTATION=-
MDLITPIGKPIFDDQGRRGQIITNAPSRQKESEPTETTHFVKIKKKNRQGENDTIDECEELTLTQIIQGLAQYDIYLNNLITTNREYSPENSDEETMEGTHNQEPKATTSPQREGGAAPLYQLFSLLVKKEPEPTETTHVAKFKNENRQGENDTIDECEELTLTKVIQGLAQYGIYLNNLITTIKGYSPENSDEETMEDTHNQEPKATSTTEETTTNAHHNDGQTDPESNSDAKKQCTKKKQKQKRPI